MEGRSAFSWRLAVLCCFAVLLPGLALSQGITVCNGHGHMSEGACVCDTPTPAAGQTGWGGPECEMEVFGALLDGMDVTAGCAGTGCNHLAPTEWMCFYSPLAWNVPDSPWKFLTVQLERTSNNDGDPDLYGLFVGGPSGQDRQLSTATYEYDFRETSSASHASVVKKIDKGAYVDREFAGVYLCVRAYGTANLTYALRASQSLCPADFTADGRRMECSSLVGAPEEDKRATGCNADGTCACKPPYQQPVANVYDGLGFADCSAMLRDVPAAELGPGRSYVREHEALPAQAWIFYAFDVRDDDFQVVVNVAGEVSENCTDFGYFGLYAKFGQPPGWRYGEWDFKPVWDYYASSDSDLELSFTQDDVGFQTGRWYAGVNGDDRAECKYTLTISKYACPMDCNNRGTCIHEDNGTRLCQCNKGYFGDDCSKEAEALQYGRQVSIPETAFEYNYWQLPPITPAMVTHSVEVRFEASFSSSAYSSWTTARPELLLLQGDATTEPTSGNYTYKMVLENQNETYHLDVCPSQLQQGVWRAAVYNPMRIYDVAYNLTALKNAHCLHDCNGYGQCSEDGECHCEGNWAGGDCSVDTSGTACPAGSRRPSRRPEAKGTCWQECVCSNNRCVYQESCADFTCDSAALRRRGSNLECVRDACTQDEWVESESASCLRACTCPEDGSACQLAPDCSPERFSCKAGHARFSNGEAKCYPVGCQDGALQEDVSRSVANGRAYGVCACGGPGDEDENGPLCSASADDESSMVVLCSPGYGLQGGQKQQGSGVVVGGACAPNHGTSGTPGWAVALWVVFSVIGGVAGGRALMWWHEHRYRVGGGNGDMSSQYHELSMDTGF